GPNLLTNPDLRSYAPQADDYANPEYRSRDGSLRSGGGRRARRRRMDPLHKFDRRGRILLTGAGDGEERAERHGRRHHADGHVRAAPTSTARAREGATGGVPSGPVVQRGDAVRPGYG